MKDYEIQIVYNFLRIIFRKHSLEVCIFLFTIYLLLTFCFFVIVGAVITDKPATQRSKEVDADDMDIDDFNLNDSLEDTLKETNVTEL